MYIYAYIYVYIQNVPQAYSLRAFFKSQILSQVQLKRNIDQLLFTLQIFGNRRIKFMNVNLIIIKYNNKTLILINFNKVIKF